MDRYEITGDIAKRLQNELREREYHNPHHRETYYCLLKDDYMASLNILMKDKKYTELKQIVKNYEDENGMTPLKMAVMNNDNNAATIILNNSKYIIDDDILAYAIPYNNLDIIDTLIEHGAPINVPHKNSRPLSLALINNNIQIIEKMVNNPNQNLEVNYSDHKLDDPIMFIFNRHIDKLNEILPRTGNMEATINGDYNVIIKLINSTQIDKNKMEKIFFKFLSQNRIEFETLKLFLKHVEVDNVDDDGISPLMYTIINRRYNQTVFLVKMGANLDTIDNMGNSAIHHACAHADFPIDIFNMIKTDANIDVKNSDGEKPIHICLNQWNSNCLDVLMQYSPNAVNDYGESLLIRAIKKQDHKIIDRLLGNTQIDTNVIDIWGESAFTCAIKKEDFKTFNNLLKIANVDVNTQDVHGETILMKLIKKMDTLVDSNLNFNTHFCPIELAYDDKPLVNIFQDVKKECVNSIKKLLLNSQTDVNISDYNGNTAIHHAINSYNYDAFNLLMRQNGLNPNLMNHEEKTPLMTSVDLIGSDKKNIGDDTFAAKNITGMPEFSCDGPVYDIRDFMMVTTPVQTNDPIPFFSKLVKDKRIDLDMADYRGDTILSYTLAKNHYLSRYLIENTRINLLHLNYSGETYLFGAVRNKLWYYVDLLIKKGCDVNVKNVRGETIESIAKDAGVGNILDNIIKKYRRKPVGWFTS